MNLLKEIFEEQDYTDDYKPVEVKIEWMYG